MKKYLKQEHVTTFFGLLLLALTTGILKIPVEYIPYVMFIAGALTLFGYKVPEGFVNFFKKPVELPKEEERKKIKINLDGE